MATTTPNFGWAVPTSTDLVKDGAVAIETLGDAIDASLVDLKGGTTGQVLAKASGTDMDFTWTNDASGISPTIFAAKGDLLGASANDTPAVLTVGANGETLVADSSTSTGLRYQGNYAAGKNKIINGDFGVWQRGTSFATAGGFLADRYRYDADGSGVTRAQSQQTFTAGTAPVAGYEGQYFLRMNQSVAGTGATYNSLAQAIEDVRTFAGQTVTVSFWAKAAATTTIPTVKLNQNFGSGGSGLVSTTVTSSISVSTSWTRYSYSVAVPSVSGKTIGTSSYLNLVIDLPLNATFTLDFWGFQIEVGSTATAFQTATGTIQGELAACQRYYFRTNATSSGASNRAIYGQATAYNTTAGLAWVKLPVTMRSVPTSIDYSNVSTYVGTTNTASFGGVSINTDWTNQDIGTINWTATGLVTTTNYFLANGTSGAGFIGFSAEL